MRSLKEVRGINWLKSPLARSANRALALASHLAVVGPAFALAVVRSGSPVWLGLYWRLAATCGAGFVVAASLAAHLETLPDPSRRRAAAGLSASGLLLLWPLFGGLTAAAEPSLSPVAWLPAGAALWLYGLLLGARPDGHVDIQRRLVLGAVLLGGTLTVAGQDALAPGFGTTAAPLILLWATGSIVSLAITRLIEAVETAASAPEIRSFWPPLLLGVALTCILVALGLSLAAGPVTALLARPVGVVLRAALMVLVYVASGVLYVLQWLIHRLLTRVEQGLEPPPVPAVPDWSELYPEQAVRELSPALIQAARLGAIAAFVAVVVAVGIYVLTRRGRLERPAAATEHRESFASADALRSWGGRRWRYLTQRLSHGARRLTGRPEPVTAIAAYNELLRQAAVAGRPRPAAVTPHRFQSQLDAIWPLDAAPHTAAILDAFAAEYYGGEGPGARWSEARHHWLALRSAGVPKAHAELTAPNKQIDR